MNMDTHKPDNTTATPDPFLATVVKDPKRHAVNKRSMFKHVVHEKGHPLNGKEIALYVHQMTGRDVDCPGDAHSNLYVDNCGVCAPNWGKVPEVLPVDMEEARSLGLAVAFSDEVTKEQQTHEIVTNGATLIGVNKLRRKNGGLCSSFMVLAWPSLKAIG